jgi:hypothetical protein
MQNDCAGLCVGKVEETAEEATMPVIVLWLGIPVILLGGGYLIIHAMH